ncbi:Lipase, GDSL, partial [Corchorus olitorius]
MGNQNFIVSFLFVVTCICNSNFLVSGCLTSIFNFGDSLSDTGNLVAISRLESGAQLPEIAFPPYGRTFFHRPTGRCCDGRLILDFL